MAKSPYTYETRRDMIVTHAWETWTNNGLGLDDDAREQATKSVQDAVNNTYTDDLDDVAWLAATLKRLDGGKPPRMTIDDFRNTREWSDDMLKKIGAPSDQPSPGFVYIGVLCIEAADSIECATGPFLLTIGNQQRFGELEQLESDLYDFACSEGYIATAGGHR